MKHGYLSAGHGGGRGRIVSGNQSAELCGHIASGNGFVFVCDLPKNHPTLHRQHTQLRDRIEVTDWGDDGLAPHATTDRRAQHA
jgi:hypothetical protein